MKIREAKRFEIGDSRHFRSHLRWHLHVFSRRLKRCEKNLEGIRIAERDSPESVTLSALKFIAKQRIEWHREYVNNFTTTLNLIERQPPRVGSEKEKK